MLVRNGSDSKGLVTQDCEAWVEGYALPMKAPPVDGSYADPSCVLWIPTV